MASKKETAKSATKPAARKAPAAKKTSVKKAPGAGKPASKAAAKAKPQSVSSELRYRMIQEAAYYMAEKDQFRGEPGSYWCAAEKQVADMLNG